MSLTHELGIRIPAYDIIIEKLWSRISAFRVY